MTVFGIALFGWLVPGGAYLLTRRYAQFAIFAVVVCATFAAGLALGGTIAFPKPGDLEGLDAATGWMFRAGALVKALAGVPYLLSRAAGASGSFVAGRLHEQGTTLLGMAGAFNLLAVASALDLRKEVR